MTQTGLALISAVTVAAILARRGNREGAGSHQTEETEVRARQRSYDGVVAKRSEKPKKSPKKQPQKSLKERRAEKRAEKKFGSG